MKIKRESDSGILGAWVFAIVFVGIVIFGLVQFSITGFEIVGVIVWLVLLTLIGCLCSLLIFHTQEVSTLEYRIIEYERWGVDSGKYFKQYFVLPTVEMARFVFHWEVKRFIRKASQKEIEEVIKRISNNEYCGPTVYDSKEEAMERIKELLKYLIASEKATENKENINIKVVETFSVTDLKQKKVD